MFVSYSRRDADFVQRLAEELKSRGKDAWIDVDGIRDAERFPEALLRAIEASDAFLFVISPDSVISDYCEQEVRHASELNKRIVPLALRAVPDEQIPEEIRLRSWIAVGEDTGVDRVVAAIDTDLEWERQHTRVTVKALEWDESGRDTSFLLRGSDLHAAERWLAEGAGKDPGPTELEQSYLLAARQAASRRQRALLGGSLTVMLVAIGLLVFALISRGQAVSAETTARAQALAAESATQQSVDPERAVLLAMAAVRTEVTYGTTGSMFALRAALDASAIRYRLPDAGTQGCGGPGVAYDPASGSNVLAEGLCDGWIRFANAATGRVERMARIGSPRAVLLAYAANGSMLVAAKGPHLVSLDPVTGDVRARSPAVPGPGVLAADPRAPIVAALEPGGVALWHITTGRLVSVHPPWARSLGQVSSMTFTPDGRRLAITFGFPGPGQPGLILADVATRRILATSPIGADTAAFSPNGRLLAVGENVAAGGSIVMLNARTLRPEPGFRRVEATDVLPSAIAFSPDGTKLGYGFADGTAGLVSSTSGQTIESYLGDNALITSVSFAPGGQIVVTGSADGTVRAWRVNGLAERVAPVGLPGATFGVEPDPGGFVSLESPGASPGVGVVARRWRDDGVASGRPLVLSATPNVGAEFLGPGDLAAVVPGPTGSASTGVVRVWNVAERRLLRTTHLILPTGGEPVLSPDGNLIAMTVQAPSRSPIPRLELDVLDLRTGRQRVLASETACTQGWRGFAFNASSRLLAAGTFCGTGVSVWDLATGRRLPGSLDISGELAWTAFSPDARHLAVASWNGTITVSPVPLNPARSVSLTENTKGVPMVAYSPDGRYLASAGLDHTVRVFDARSLAELRVIPAPVAVEGIAFTANSQRLLSWGADSSVRLWDACTDCQSPGALLALARSRVTRSLTPAERRTFAVN